METKNTAETWQYVIDWECFKEGKAMKKEMRITKVDNGYIIKEGEGIFVYNRFNDVVRRITEFFGEKKIEKKKKKERKK